MCLIGNEKTDLAEWCFRKVCLCFLSPDWYGCLSWLSAVQARWVGAWRFAFPDIFAAFFHEPFGCACCAADADGFGVVEPSHVDFGCAFYLVAVGIDAEALFEKYFPVGALAAGYENHDVVAAGECGDVGHAVGDLPTDGVEAFELGAGGNVGAYVVDDVVKFVEALCGL